MPNRSLYHCPYPGCNQTSTRRWNMGIHIKRRHKDGRQSIPTDKQPSFSSNQREAAEASNHYMYGPTYRLNTSVDEGKNAESMLDKNLETFRKFLELSNESARNSAAGSMVSEIAKSLMIQMFSNLPQGKRNKSTKKEILATGYRTTHCDKCLSGSIEPVFNPIVVEGVTKLVHNCKNENLLDGRVRKKLKVPVNKSLIEERDSIKINLPCDRDRPDHFWFCRAIREVGKNNGIIKINQKELVEFLRIAKSTFGVFTDIVRKDYFLIYLEL
jgi:hypothetical protein